MSYKRIIITKFGDPEVLQLVAHISAGDSILIHGAAGAVGIAMLQLGKLMNLTVYGTASKAKHAIVKKHGGIPIDYKSEDFVKRVHELSDGGVEFMKILLWNILPNNRKSSFYIIGSLRKKHPEWFKEDLTQLFQLLEKGDIKPEIENHFPLEKAAEVHHKIEKAEIKGKIVFDIS